MLAGIQVPAAALGRFRESLQRLGYRHADQSDSLAYKVFLT